MSRCSDLTNNDDHRRSSLSVTVAPKHWSDACNCERRLLTKMFSDVVHLSHSRFHNFHNFILPVAIFVFFFSVCVAADDDAEVSIGDVYDDGGDCYNDDFATHVDDNDDNEDDKI
ncbi:hypothetical protein ElyMa_004537100 [Elysia marginata]|uniref:Transmembrane protein n=1 Tax=Elysia marginata TaxID=1093978 RepID=A0AAV4HQQ6_9GAST|nr:hypothetical protein ElyMa_004537100 [Elysia marginata]